MYKSHPLSEKACRPACSSQLAPERKKTFSGSFFSPISICFTCWCWKTSSDTFRWKKSLLHLLHLLNSCRLFPLIFDQPFMSSNANTENMVENTFSACSGPDWCPHSVQVALVINLMGTPRKDGDAITSRTVIAAREVVATAAKSSSIRHGSHGTPLCKGEGTRETANSARMRLTLRNVDGYHSNLYSE